MVSLIIAWASHRSLLASTSAKPFVRLSSCKAEHFALHAHKFSRTTLNPAKVPFQEPPSHNTAATSPPAADGETCLGIQAQMRESSRTEARLNVNHRGLGFKLAPAYSSDRGFLETHCPRDHTLFYKEPHRCLSLITRSGNFQKQKASGLESVPYLHSDTFILFIVSR